MGESIRDKCIGNAGPWVGRQGKAMGGEMKHSGRHEEVGGTVKGDQSKAMQGRAGQEVKESKLHALS